MSKIYIVAGHSVYEMEALIETDLEKAKVKYREMIDDELCDVVVIAESETGVRFGFAEIADGTFYGGYVMEEWMDGEDNYADEEDGE